MCVHAYVFKNNVRSSAVGFIELFLGSTLRCKEEVRRRKGIEAGRSTLRKKERERTRKEKRGDRGARSPHHSPCGCSIFSHTPKSILRPSRHKNPLPYTQIYLCGPAFGPQSLRLSLSLPGSLSLCATADIPFSPAGPRLHG